ncbi:MAG: ATP-dependent helicase, partial [Betaproteobacteria bacterium]
MTRPDPFVSLNDEQRAAVEHGLPDAAQAPPLLVVAGAGTGKTTTLAARVARLVLAGADPRRILLLTFSRRAAQEMERRVGALLQRALGLAATQRPPALPWAGTFHAVAARLLGEIAPRIGLASGFTILDRADAEDLLALLRQDLGFAASRQRFPLKGTCLAICSRVVNGRAPLAEVLREHFPWCAGWEAELKRLFAAYAAEKQREQVLDYDDLLLWWAHALEDAALAAALGARFPLVLVDEYQDTNRLQSAILRALKPDGRGLAAFGDDAQSIYSFRAADVRNMLDFGAHFTAPARVVTLERNYRSTQPILDAANAVIAGATEGWRKALRSERRAAERPQLVAVDDEARQAEWVADRVLERREAGLALKQQAVLFRAAHHVAALELELVRRDIPYVKFGGLKFLEAAHVKDLLSVLRWAQNPRSRLAGFRVAQLVPGIGPAHARRLLDAMDAADDPHAALRAFDPPAAATDAWHEWRVLYDALRDPASPWPGEVESAIGWLAPLLEARHDDAAVRLADLRQLAQLAHGHATRERFLAELTLDPPEATSDEAGPPHRDEDYLILSTIHSAKGQERAAVQLLNVVDGCIPSDLATGRAAEIEEERRLLYVAMTRAKHHLALLVPQRFHVTQQGAFGDRHLYGSLSRFVPPAVAALFDAVAPPVPAGAAGDAVAA